MEKREALEDFSLLGGPLHRLGWRLVTGHWSLSHLRCLRLLLFNFNKPQP